MQVHRIQNNNYNTNFKAKLSVKNPSNCSFADLKLVKKLFEKKTAHYPNLIFNHTVSRFNSDDMFMLADDMGNELFFDKAAFTRLKISSPEKRAGKYAEIFDSMVIKAIKAGHKININ